MEVIRARSSLSSRWVEGGRSRCSKIVLPRRSTRRNQATEQLAGLDLCAADKGGMLKIGQAAAEEIQAKPLFGS